MLWHRFQYIYFSSLPDWVGGKEKNNYVATHKVWSKRYHYMDSFVPEWMRKILFFVSDDSWKYEEWEWNKFQKHAEPHFGKYYVFPNKTFNDFNSMRHEETVENLEVSDNSITNANG